MKITMKLLPSVLASCFLCLGLACQSAWGVLVKNEPSGFRGNRWGALPEECASLRYVKDMGTTQSGQRITIYDRSTVGIIINGASFSRIRYRFLDNQLESVQLSFEGRENRDRLVQVVEDRYGPLTPGERKYLARAEWDGYETTVDLDYNVEMGRGSLWFISTALHRDFAW